MSGAGAQFVAPGLLATVVTTLDHSGKRVRRANPPDASLDSWGCPRRDPYRALFRRVGAPWLWFSRLALSDSALDAILTDPLVQVLRVRVGAEDAGFVEIDNRQAGQSTLQFVGLAPEWIGRGLGGWMIGEAVALAWSSRVERVRVQTCTLDHAAALPSYRRAGFEAIGREVQVFPDPRLLGLLPPSAAPQVPLIRP